MEARAGVDWRRDGVEKPRLASWLSSLLSSRASDSVSRSRSRRTYCIASAWRSEKRWISSACHSARARTISSLSSRACMSYESAPAAASPHFDAICAACVRPSQYRL